LINGKILKSEFYETMTSSRRLSNGKVTGYGCGLAVAVQERRTVLRHSGAVAGFNAFNAVVPSTKSALVLLCNKDGGLGSLPETLTALVLKEESNIPRIAGLAAADAVKKVFAQLQSAEVDRSQFGEEFNLYLSDEKVTGAAKRLKVLGAPKSAQVIRTYERGGLEVTTTLLKFDSKELQVLMYRAPQGRIEQFFVDEK
jgi:CubicO group peptidase (beta-lactamase class C family)